MRCASCVARLEKKLKSVPGVHDALVNLSSGEAPATFAPGSVDIAELEHAVEHAGYTAHARAEQPAQDTLERQDVDRARDFRL